jgi:hypothetical protein
MNKSYGSQDLQRNWYDVSKYLSSKKWEENKVLTKLRPSMEALKGKKDLIGVESGIGSCLNSQNIYKNLDIKKLYLIDVNDPPREPGTSLLKKDNVVFLKGNSIDKLKEIEEPLDFVYLDSSHEFNHLLNEIRVIYPKLKKGGIIGGHDYEHIGVVSAVNTLMFNIWRNIGKKPDTFFFESCLDEHPGIPEEYSKFGFPVDWWHIKNEELSEEFVIHELRNG